MDSIGFSRRTFLALWRLFFALVIIFPLLGLNVSALISRMAQHFFNVLEVLFFTAVIALLLAPLLVTMVAGTALPVTPLLPMLFTALSFLIAIWANPRFLESLPPTQFKRLDFVLYTLVFLIYTGFISFIVTAYPALPDLDPYYWYTRYDAELTNNELPRAGGYRPLFASLTYLFYRTAGIDLFAYFKYVLPFLSLVCLVPLEMISRRFDSTLPRLAVFTLPLATASYTLYTLTPIPQSLFNIIIIFFVAAIFQATHLHNRFYFLTSGGILLTMTLYHEMAVLLFVLWLIFFAIRERHFLSILLRLNLVPAILLLFLVIDLGFSTIAHLYSFFTNGISHVLGALFSISTNFSFPATYVNIDGMSVGWNTWQGVIKYYMYYAGPIVFWVLFIWLSAREKLFAFMRTQPTQVITLLLWISAFFFLLAEILPRFFNIAFLPERAWGYVTLFAAAYTLSFLSSLSHAKQQWLAAAILIGAGINAGGAIYINSLKQYLLTPAHFASAEWIKTATPDYRILLSLQYRNLLQVHGQSQTIDVNSPDLYTDIRIFDETLRRYQLDRRVPWNLTDRYLSTLSSSLTELSQKRVHEDAEAFSTILTRVNTETQHLRERIGWASSDSSKELPAIYIYYARPSERNPYIQRPYMKEGNLIETADFCFDRYPERFERVYSLPEDEVIIWKLLQ